jgi:hypothetical protein
MSAAASSIRFDVFDLVIGLPAPGLRGSGGGALSGSELSHLTRRSTCLRLIVVVVRDWQLTWARSFCQTPSRSVDASPSETQHGRGSRLLPS